MWRGLLTSCGVVVDMCVAAGLNGLFIQRGLRIL
jgi:hypothetical protein